VSGLVMYNECDMGHVYNFIIMNNHLSFQGPICIYIYRHVYISISVTDD
jgi:hypothetical protein